MIAVVTIIDDETGKYYVKEQKIKPIREENTPYEDSKSFFWQFGFTFVNDYKGVDK